MLTGWTAVAVAAPVLVQLSGLTLWTVQNGHDPNVAPPTTTFRPFTNGSDARKSLLLNQNLGRRWPARCETFNVRGHWNPLAWTTAARSNVVFTKIYARLSDSLSLTNVDVGNHRMLLSPATLEPLAGRESWVVLL